MIPEMLDMARDGDADDDGRWLETMELKPEKDGGP